MKAMKKTRIYRALAAFMAALLVFTCMPQTSLYAWAEETPVEMKASEDMGEEIGQEQMTVQTEEPAEQTAAPTAEQALEPSTSPVPEGMETQEADAEPKADPPAKDPVHVSGITLDHDELTIQREDSADLKFTLAPDNADVDTEKVVTFSSANTDIATVTATGTGATIVGEGCGQTTITATTGNGKTARCVVTVTPIPVKGMTVTPEKLQIAKGKTEKVSVKLDPLNADEQGLIIGSYYDKKIIEVDYNASTNEISVKGLKGGYTTLSVRARGNAKVFKEITVEVDEGEIELTAITAKTGYSENLYEGDEISLKKYVTFTPGDATDKTLVWSVEGDGTNPDENPARSYVDVNQYGWVTAKWDETDTNSEKEVKIKAASKTYPDVTPATFTLTIKRSQVPLKAFHLETENLILEDDGEQNQRVIGIQLVPLASTDRKITATVSGTENKTAVVINAGDTYKGDEAGKTAVGTANVNGWVYFTVKANKLAEPKTQDSCTITFTQVTNSANATAIKAKCSVTVNKYVTPVESLELDDTLELEDLSTEDLTAVITPTSAEDRNIVWTVDDPEIALIKVGDAGTPGTNVKTEAAVNADGVLAATVKIQANMVGTCTITATAAGNVKKICTVTVRQSTNKPVEGLTIISDGIPEGETTEITIKPGKSYQLKPSIMPEDADNKKVKWTSGSPDVASVDATGKVTANDTGVCVITARASGEAEECTKTVKVNVKEPLIKVSYKGYPQKWSYTPADQPITEEMLRKELVVTFYPRMKPIPEDDELLLGSESGNDNYDLKILKEDGKTEKLYNSDDMAKPGTRTLVISYLYEEKTYKEYISVEMKEFDAADLISVTPLSGDDAEIWNVTNATPPASLPLPKTTEITVGREILVEGKPELKTSKLDAEIDWHVADIDYDPSNADAQEFTVFGDVVLPNYVTNSGNVSKRVQTKVHVREKAVSGKKMVRPKFSALGGEEINDRTAVELPYGTKIEIKTLTEDAVIYYMLDRRPDEKRGVPQDAEHKYTSPIEITSKTTTIYAIATKHGYDDSDCSECTIKLVQADPVDPDDPNAGPLPDDVTDEDREQIGGRVPDGLWAAVQMGTEERKAGGFAYTGKAIKPAVHVYDRTMLLTEKTDYTIAYSNNVNAGSAEDSAKPPTITVTGRGNYEGKAVVHFVIKPQSINDDSVFMDEYLAAAYNGKAQNPNPTLTWDGKKLSKNRDYTYTDTSYTEAGTYKFTVTGVGNYTGSRTVNYEIFQGGVAVSKLTISKIANQKYTGSQIRPTVTVKYKSTPLVEGTEKSASGNYWIKYENCTSVGNASIVIVGKGNYKGSKRINFKILPIAAINKAGITLDNIPSEGVAYNGKPYTPKVTVNYAGKKLEENKEYKLSYQNNVKAGTATVVITGMGPYTGTAKKTFKILQNDISGLTAVMGSSFAYEKGGCKPKPEITCNGLKLVEGTDYTLTYRNNNKIGNTASVAVKGKGSYKGQIVRYFEVTMQDISKLKVVASDKAYQQKKNIYKTKVQVIDLNGQALTAGSDYAKDIYYTYESGTKAGQPVLSTDIIPAGTVIGVDVRVANPRCYQGTVHGTYRIVQADISGAKVSINPQEYTGRSIRPNKSQIQVTLKGVLLRNDDYEIVSYENNVKQGDAKITIRGVGSYGGMKTATFKIRKKGILNLKF